MTEERLAEIEATCEGVTPGPWFTKDVPQQCYVFSDRANIAILCDGGTINDEFWRNRAFIAASRTAVPELIAEIRRLRALLAAIREQAEACADAGGGAQFAAENVLGKLEGTGMTDHGERGGGEVEMRCPFCGGEGEMGRTLLKNEGDPARWWRYFAVCAACGANGPVTTTTHAALTAWNRRAATERLAVLEQTLRDLLPHLPGSIVTRDVGVCVGCGEYTPGGAMRLCERCAVEAARAALAGEREEGQDG